MKKISDREVEYEDDEELAAAAAFDDLLDDGLNIEDAVARVRSAYPHLDPALYDWFLK